MDASTRARIAALAGRPVVAAERIVGGGYSPAERWRVRLADGERAFAKVATNPLTVEAIRTEGRRYRWLPVDFAPRFLGFDDHPERPLVLLEDLSDGRWPPPWEPGDVERVLRTMARVARFRPPAGELLPVAERRSLAGWAEVAADPAPFLALRLASPGWLARALATLREAERDAPVAGDDLLHFDLRSDNLVLLPDRVVLVDWNLAVRGDARLDLAFWAPSLRLEGGPPPEALVPDAGPLAAVVAGFFAARAGLPEIPDAPRVRWIQRQQLRIALPWACRVLGVPEPDGDAPPGAGGERAGLG